MPGRDGQNGDKGDQGLPGVLGETGQKGDSGTPGFPVCNKAVAICAVNCYLTWSKFFSMCVFLLHRGQLVFQVFMVPKESGDFRGYPGSQVDKYAS